jgi:hypothetical protein
VTSHDVLINRETLNYLLDLVLDERIRLDRRVFGKRDESLKDRLYRRNDDARRLLVDLLEVAG